MNEITISPPCSTGSWATLCSQALGCSQLFPGLTLPHSQGLGLFSLLVQVPPGFRSILTKKRCLCSSLAALPARSPSGRRLSPVPSSSTADPMLLTREQQCWEMAGTGPCFTSQGKLRLAPVLLPHTLISKPPWHPHRCCEGIWWLTGGDSLSCGTFNPFLLSLLPWCCCCSDGHSVYVAMRWGQSSSGSAEPKRPGCHGMPRYRRAGRLEMRCLSCPTPGPAVGKEI